MAVLGTWHYYCNSATYEHAQSVAFDLGRVVCALTRMETKLRPAPRKVGCAVQPHTHTTSIIRFVFENRSCGWSTYVFTNASEIYDNARFWALYGTNFGNRLTSIGKYFVTDVSTGAPKDNKDMKLPKNTDAVSPTATWTFKLALMNASSTIKLESGVKPILPPPPVYMCVRVQESLVV